MKNKIFILVLFLIFILSLIIASILVKTNYENNATSSENTVIEGTMQEELTKTEIAPEEEIISDDLEQNNIYDEAVNTALLELSGDEFEEKVLKADKKVLVDFYADWCLPCHMFSPVVEEVAKENENVYFYRINVDENDNLANRYKIMYLPTLICFESGEELNRFIGAGNKEDVLELIK